MSSIFHSNYYAHELTRRFSSEKFEKLSQSLFNATVDLNPHQIEAALFAFRSPLSRGAILADEVGLDPAAVELQRLDGSVSTLANVLAETWTDGVIVLHDAAALRGRVERDAGLFDELAHLVPGL